MMVVMVMEKIERRLKVGKEVEIRSIPNHPDNMLWPCGYYMEMVSVSKDCIHAGEVRKFLKEELSFDLLLGPITARKGS